jgi:hypothetical protein
MSFLEMINSYWKTYRNYICERIDFFLLCRKKYKNYLAVLLQASERNYPIDAILRNGQKKVIIDNYYELYNSIMNSDPLMNLKYEIENDLVYINELQFYGGITNGDIIGVFLKDEYRFLPVRDKVVIDIGASIGDSPILFASRGATKVIAVEPNRESYELAKKNTEANSLSDKIEIICAACDFVDINNPVFGNPSVMTLQSISNRYQLDHAILKMDCEGCEYPVILSTPNNILDKFDYLQIEYHYGYKNLKEKLEASDFQVDLTKPTYFKKDSSPPASETRYSQKYKTK